MRGRRRIGVLSFAAIAGLPLYAGAATFTVNTTDVIVRGNCSPLCSLPDAMALAHDGDLIAFHIDTGHQVIDARGASVLFSTNGHVTIDGTTQPGFAIGHPVIEVKGAAFALYSGSSLIVSSSMTGARSSRAPEARSGGISSGRIGPAPTRAGPLR